MPHVVKIDGKNVSLEWTKATERAFYFRLSEIGFILTSSSFKGAKASSSFCKCLWALLPSSTHRQFETPEDLFVAIDHDAEGADIYAAITAIFAEMNPSEEKKSTLTKSPSHESNSD